MKRSELCAYGILLGLVVFAAIAPSPGAADDSVFTIPRNQLLNDAEFGAKAWGPGTLVSRTAGPGDAVDFTFTGLGTSGTGVKDDYPVDPVYGQVIPSHGNGDFSGFSGYAMRLENLDAGAVWMQLCINTGFTGPSGTPSSDLTNNTFWTSSPPWTQVGPGEEVLVILDFDGAVAYQISDNRVPHTGGGLGWPDGGVYTINAFDRAEVSAIGFEIADFSGTNPDAVIRLTPVAANAEVGWNSSGARQGIALTVSPNPGSAITARIDCAGPRVGGALTAAVTIYDVRGRLVSNLWHGTLSGGQEEFGWDGARAGGGRCAPGLYIIRLDAGNVSLARPIVLIE